MATASTKASKTSKKATAAAAAAAASTASAGPKPERKYLPTFGDDDDDDSDDDDEEEEVKAAKEGTKLTAEQQRLVLQFYGLDVLEPDKWTPTKTILDTIGMGSSEMLLAATTTATPGTSTSASSSAAAAAFRTAAGKDETDLLGLRAGGGSLAAGKTPVKVVRRPRSINSPADDGKSVYNAHGGDDDAKDPNSIDPTSVDFSPHAYLAVYYPDASYQDLQKGMQRLQASLEQNTEFLRTLVRNNLDRFMNSKEAIDAFYHELKDQELIGDAAGSRALRSTIKSAVDHTQTMFDPMLQRRVQADNLRKRLTFYEQNKFIFNLPAMLRVAIAKKNYDQAVRDYKKGRQYADSDTPAYSKAWKEVLTIVKQLKTELSATLRDQTVSVDVQERLIEHLVDLQTNAKGEFEGTSDPAYDFVTDRHESLRRQMQTLATVFSNKIRDINAIPVRHDQNDLRRRRTVSVVLHNRLGVFVGEGAELQDELWKKWQLFQRHVERLSVVFSSTVPDLARLVRSYVDGQFSKRLGFASKIQSSQNTNRARSVVNDIVETYSGHIHNALQMVVTQDGKPIIVAPLQAVFIISRVNSDIVQCWDIARNIKHPSGGAVEITTNKTFGKIRNTLVGVVCDAWLSETSRFAEYEHWAADSQSTQTTVLPRLFHEFSRLILLSLRDIAVHSTNQLPASDQHEVRLKIQPSLRDKIRSTAFETVDAFANVLHTLGTASAESINLTMIVARTRRLGQTLIGNVDDPAVRLLVVLSNAVYIKDTMLPLLKVEFETFFQVSAAHVSKTTTGNVNYLESLLYKQYLGMQLADCAAIVERGMLWDGMNWMQVVCPSELRSYVYEAMMRIVRIHCQITDTSRSILQRALSDVVMLLANCYMDMVTQIGQFGLGGMMQALMEIEFVQQTLGAYETSTSKALFSSAIALLRTQTRIPIVSRDPNAPSTSMALAPTEVKDPQLVVNELKEVRDTLKKIRKASEAQFSSFTTQRSVVRV